MNSAFLPHTAVLLPGQQAVATEMQALSPYQQLSSTLPESDCAGAALGSRKGDV